MSRIARRAVPVPAGIQLQIKPSLFEVKGPKGTMSMPVPAGVQLKQEGGRLVFLWDAAKGVNAPDWGTTRALANNLIQGCSKGFERILDLEGVGYRAELKGKDTLSLSLGFSHPVEIKVPAGIACKVDKQVRIVLQSSDKAALGQFAAKVRAVRPPEPFKGKGVRYNGEVIRRKEGKARK